VPLIGDNLARSSMTPAQQQYDQAAKAWVRAKLRKESGASIGVHEMDGEIATFFPQPQDGPAVRAQKAAARELANRAMESAAGRAPVVSMDTAPASIDVGAALGVPAPVQRTPGGPARPQALPKSNPQPAAGANRVVQGSW
jgi:hypothetical protein